MEWAQQIIEQYGYWAVFLGTFAEGEVVFLAAAALAAAGLMDTWKVVAIAAVGAFVGHIFFFALGRWKGMAIINAVPTFKAHYPKANRILDHYALWSVFIFQYLYGTRIVAAILFGASSISFWRFLAIQIVNCITWALVVYAAGHFLGFAALHVIEQFGMVGLGLAIGGIIIFALLAYFGYTRWHHESENLE